MDTIQFKGKTGRKCCCGPVSKAMGPLQCGSVSPAMSRLSQCHPNPLQR